MEIQEIKKQTIWNKFFNENGSVSFLQSWQWGEMQKELGNSVFHLGLFNNNQIQLITQVIVVKARRANFLFIPHGPITQVKNEKLKVESYFKHLIKQLIILAKENKCSFIRIAPIIENSHENLQLFTQLGFKKAPIYMHAEDVWVLSINKPEERLLAKMRKTTRYLIRKATKDGVIIEKRTDDKAIDDFYKIYEETAKRESFVPFSKDYIAKEFNAFNITGNAIFLFGKQLSSDYLAATLIIFTKSTGFYHQGASFHTKIPVTYLLQWEAIKESKKRGCSFYNFWGISPNNNPNHPWFGLTQFKKGFSGQMITYLPTLDLPISLKYYLTYYYEKFLRWQRKV